MTARIALAALLVLPLAGCRRALTEIVVVVGGDACDPTLVDAVTVTATVGSSAPHTARYDGTPVFPLTVSLIDDGDPSATVDVVVTALHGGAAVFAQERRAPFVAGASQQLQLSLTRACATVTCAAGMTCADGVCVAIDAGPDVLTAWTGAPTSTGGVCSAGCPGADVNTDPANCGACGHACTSGACVGGVCQVLLPAEVAGGMASTCARRLGGDVACWGDNTFGQLGGGTNTPQASLVPVASLHDARVLAVAADHACAVRSDGNVACWGRNAEGQLGDGTTRDSSAPVAVSSLGNVNALARAAFATCAQRGNGEVWCWGQGDSGVLGDGRGADSATPVRVMGLPPAPVALACGGFHCCVLPAAPTATAWCWGRNTEGELGDGTTTDRLAPVSVSVPDGTQALALGYQFTCALNASGAVYCWGDNPHGQLGDTMETVRRAPGPPVSGVTTAQALVAGAFHACALRRDSSVVCWGDNTYGALGNGTTATAIGPVVVTGLSGVQRLGAGYYHTCAITGAASPMACWGRNDSGQLGSGSAALVVPQPASVVGVP